MVFRWMLAGAVFLAACSGEPNGDGWPVLEVVEEVPVPDASVVEEVDMGLPPAPDLPPPMLAADSTPCTDGSECAGGDCLTGDDYPNGFCTTADCANGAACAEGSLCRENRREGTSHCAPSCDSDDACGDGLACRYDFRTRNRMCLPIRGAADGEPCSSPWECQNFSCIPELGGGYCATVDCRTSDDCANQRAYDNVCLQSGGVVANYCVRRCSDDTDCLDHHKCTDVGGGETVCIADPVRPFDDAVFDPSPLDIQCGIPVENGIATIDYEVAPTTTSYLVTPMARDGQPIAARRIILPDLSEIDFVREREALAWGASQIFGSMNPTLVPSSPSFMDMLAPGTNQYVLGADGQELCYYMLEKDAPGNTLDLNVYLVGVPGVTAATAGSDPNFTAMFDEVERIYGQFGVELGVVRFFDADDDSAMRFSVVRHNGDLEKIVELSEAPGTDLESMLSMNVFFVGQFGFGGGAIGSSQGLPGPAGLHGTRGSGVVFTAEFMGQSVPQEGAPDVDGNEYTGLILAHEVGHWLGLNHTTQLDFQTYDPIGDTAECTVDDVVVEGDRNAHIELCPDWGNLMFPIAGEGNTTVTPDQAFVLKGNPIIRTVQGVTP